MEKEYAELPIDLEHDDRVKLEALIHRHTGIRMAMEALTDTAGRLAELSRQGWEGIRDKYNIDPDLEYDIECKLGSGQVTMREGR